MGSFPSGSNSLIDKEWEHWLAVNYSMLPNEVEPSSNNSDSQSINTSETSFEDNWEYLGDKLNFHVPIEHLRRLAHVFPGVKEIAEAASVYGGVCALCSSGLSPDDAALDFFDGNFYCSKCHQGQEVAIPHDIIECWDFKPKPVSFATKKFLDSIIFYPLIDISLINPSLFTYVPELANLRRLRRTIFFLWSTVSRCSKTTSHGLVSAMKRRSYMLDNVEKYSLQDLLDIPSGDLEELIQTVINQTVLTHTTSCLGCHTWVSFCDVCRDVSKPIWPYAFTEFRRGIQPIGNSLSP